MVSTSSKVAIVTGAAGGIGSGLARDLVSKGWNVGCLDVNEAAGNALIAELGDTAVFIRCDISDYDDQARAFTAVWQKWGRLDALLANAGIIDRSSVYILDRRSSKEVPPKPDLASTEIDFKALLYGVQLSVHFMRQNATPGGQIVATASLVGVHPLASFPEYSANKAAVIAFARAAAPILKLKDNITVNVVAPGLVPTQVIPQAMRDALGPECVTPVANIVAAYHTFLEDPTLTGQVVECSGDKAIFLPPPPFANGDISKRTTTVYEPYFRLLHKEDSGLPETIF